jgi:exosortase A
MRARLTTLDETCPNAENLAAWRPAGVLAMAGIIALLVGYYPTFRSMVDIWWRSETFAHGFLIFPISLWLIWRRRRALARLAPRPDYRAVPVLVLLGLGWLVAHVSSVLVVEQYALIAMIPALVWLLLGPAITAELAFPLGFLLFAVPTGEFLIPPMMGFTADFTVTMLQLTGIPVFREGTFFSIPSGDWSVVEGCSGMRYLIASVTLGCLYAYLSYRSLWRRLALILLATLLPVIANGLRAYFIVMIAHASNMTLAMGVDHFIYGWVFFGLTMLLLFWLGSFWSERETAPREAPAPSRFTGAATPPSFLKSLAIGLGIVLVWPTRAAYLEQVMEARNGAPVELALPEGAGRWRTSEPLTDWAPAYVGADVIAQRCYSDGTSRVGLYLMYYRHQRQGAELINSNNVLVRQKHPIWKMPGERPVAVQLHGQPNTVLQGSLIAPEIRLLTWRWNRIGRAYTASEFWGKWLEARNKLLDSARDEAGIVIATDYSGAPESAARVLQSFVDAMLPPLEASLDRAAGS